MTDENQTEESEGGKTSRLTISLLLVVAAVFAVVFLVVLVIVLFPQILLGFVILFESSPDHHLTCDYVLTADTEMRDSWIKSENITSYKDIPKQKRENLSNDTKESLKKYSSDWYAGTDYSNLSEKEKNIFNQTRYGQGVYLNGKEYDRYGDKFTNSVILYKGLKIYRCEIHTYRGA